MIKIAFTGPESSGKSTLSQWTAIEFDGSYCEEYAREFLLKHGPQYVQADLDTMALSQVALWQNAANNHLLVCDTEMVVLKIWSEWKYESCSNTIQLLLQSQQFDHYFLCYPDIPWEDDPMRENPESREELFQLYLDELVHQRFPFSILKGSLQGKQETIRQIVAPLVAAAIKRND